MEVPPQLSQPLSIDTNITYSLDLSMFPGLDDPEHKYQPALLIAPPAEIIPSPTSDTHNDDLLAITDWQNSILQDPSIDTHLKYTCRVAPPRQERNHQQIHQHLQSDQRNVQPTKPMCFNPHQGMSSRGLSGNNHLAKYALQAIFQNLIYPDVSRSRSFNLDTLVQSASSEPTASFSRFHSQRDDIAEKLRHITDNACSNSSYDGAQRNGKRKRSYDQSYDNGSLKRLRHEKMSRDSSPMYFPDMQYSGHQQGSVLMHRRVRELLCHM